jgi:hypothetical protein
VCVGTLVLEPECAAVNAQLDFHPSEGVAASIRSARAALFGSPTAPFRILHFRRGDKCDASTKIGHDTRCGPVATQPFLGMCGGGGGGGGGGEVVGKKEKEPPLYVATDDISYETHAVLRRSGCKTFKDIPGWKKLKDWESASMDQFMMAEATAHFTMGCSSMDTVASASRRLRGLSVGEPPGGGKGGGARYLYIFNSTTCVAHWVLVFGGLTPSVFVLVEASHF